MSDWQQPPQGYPPPKKRTGLIIAIVIIALLLLCCCSVGVAVLLFRSDPGTTSTTTASPEDLAKKQAEEAELAKRAADWKKVQAALVRGDYTFAEPDARQARLAEAAIAALLPDFTIDEVAVEPGHYDKAKDYFVFDGFYIRLHLTSDPQAKTAYSFDVETTEAEATGMTRDKLDVDSDEDVTQLEGKTWVIFPTETKAPLLRGIKDPAIGRLVKQACADWPDGLPTKFVLGTDGSIVVSVETWDNYRYSDTFDRIDATYVRDGQGWKIKSYVPIIEPKDGSSTDSTQT